MAKIPFPFILSAGVALLLLVRYRASSWWNVVLPWLEKLDPRSRSSAIGMAVKPEDEKLLVEQLNQLNVTLTRAQRNRKDDRLFYVQIGISILVLLTALYVIVAPSLDPRDKHWAYGAVGSLMGFWLKK